MPTVDQARLWYPEPDPVHGFDHVLRVYYLAEKLADSEGADLEIVHTAALLHDANGENAACDQDPKKSSVEFKDKINRSSHHLDSAEFAARILQTEGWAEDRIAAVQHCIRAHRFRETSEPPTSLEAKVLFDADKLDAIGAIGVARAIAYAVLSGQPIYMPTSASFLESGALEIGEAHSAYHEYIHKLIGLKDCLFTPSGQALAEERHCVMVEFFERMVQEIQFEA